MSQLPTMRTVSRLRACLQDRLARIEKRSITVAREMMPPMQEGSVQHRELLKEQGELQALAAQTKRALCEMDKRDSAEDEARHEHSVRLMMRAADAQHVRSQENWLRQSDYRSARQYRMENLDLRFRVEAEMGTTGLPR